MRQDLLINSSAIVLNFLEKIFNANIQVKGLENIPKGNPRVFVANHFTRMEAMIVPYALYEITNKKVGVIADDGLFNTYLGSFLEELGAMRKSEPFRNNIIVGDLLTGCKDWLIFPEGRMVKAKDISKEGNHYCVKIDGICQRVHTGSAFFALSSQLLRENYLNKKIKDITKFQRKHFIQECKNIQEEETVIIPINISYSKLRTGENFLSTLALKFLDNISEHFLEELEIEGNIILNSKIIINILKPISTKNILKNIYKKEPNHTKIVNTYRYDLTHKFMTLIYENLTISFDHLFVLTLALSPKKKVEKNHFKRVLYLIVNKIKKNFIQVDEDIDKKLISLISYERHKPFENILSVVVKDKIVKEDKEYYYINKENLLKSYTHHTIRLKNISRVILNEILINDKAKNIVKKYILTSKKNINKTLLELLIKKERKEFEKDYLKFANAEDTKPIEIGKSFTLEHEGNSTCIIIVHGFSSSPKEVEQLSNYLYKNQFDVYAPRLRGHGTSPLDLKNRTWQDWYLSLSRAITIASLKYEKIYIVGFSTGGLLALLSTKKCYKQIQGVVCINAALNLNDIRIKTLLPAVSFWNDLVKAFNANDYAKEYIDNISENPEVNYNKHYIKAIKQLSLLMEKTKKNIPKIETKTFIIQAKNDPIVNPNSAYEIYDNIKSKNKQILLVDFNRHIIVKGEDTKELFKSIKNFLK